MQARLTLGIEGGGTKTIALLSNGQHQIFGPLNLKLATDRQIISILRQSAIGYQLSAISLCLAGCRTSADRARIRALARRVWPKVEVFVGNDLDSGHAAAFGANQPGILVICGTGSSVFGRNAAGITARAGGWGHILGDHGSGYWIALAGLRNAIRDYDRNGKIRPALRRVLSRLALNTPDQLVDWIQSASKADIATLAGEMMRGDRALVLQAASFLAMDAHAVARKLGLTGTVAAVCDRRGSESTAHGAHRAPLQIALTGGVLTNNPALYRHTVHRLRQFFPQARIFRPKRESVAGALLLASKAVTLSEAKGLSLTTEIYRHTTDGPQRFRSAQNDKLALTEHRNPRTMDLDKLPVSRLIEKFLAEENRVVPAIRKNKRAICRAINTIVAAFKHGGRLFYIGAGTSGRLGVLDASECPPTFSTDPDMVQGIIAGGAPALHSAAEVGEDDAQAGAEVIRNRGVGSRDVVIGIAASGSTPFVLGALDEAKRLGAKTFLLCFSAPRSPFHAPLFFPTGPEFLTGSTRLKAGTATKLVLNMLTTISMIRLGKVVSNLMVDVKPTNEKLRARACRIVAAVRRCNEAEARQRLERTGWNVKRALR